MATAPGVVFSLRFVQASAAQDTYSRYAVGYMSRPQAFEENEHEDDALYHDADPCYDQYGYMSNKDKTDGLFDANSDLVSEYDQYRYTGIFDASQVRGCPLYQGVISFRNDFLRKYQIDYRTPEGIARLKQIARLGIADMIHESKLQDDNVVWTAAIHTNTDNIHVHIAVVEKEKVQRRYDKLETKAFDQLKSRVANAIVGDREKVELSQIFQRDLPHEIQTAAAACGVQLEELLRVLPPDVTWQYNRDGMAPYRAAVNECVDQVIASSDLLTARYNQGMEALRRYDQLIREMYGDAKRTAVYDEKTGSWSMSDHKPRELAEQAAANKLKDFYARAGNALLGEARALRESRSAVPPEGAATGAAARPAGEKREIAEPENMPGSRMPDTDMEAPVSEYEAPPEAYRAPVGEEPEPPAGRNGPDAIDRLIQRSEQGDERSMYQLAVRLLKGDGVEKDETRASRLLEMAADRGNPYAAYRLAGMYRDGAGVVSNEVLTEKYFYLAFKGFSEMESISGDSRQQYRIGTMYQYGEGVPFDPAMAAQYYRYAADQGDVQAQLALARLYVDGEESVKNFPEGLRILRQLADGGNATARIRLGKIYRDGDGTEKNPAEARQWFRAANEAKQEAYRRQHPGEPYAAWTDEYRDARDCLYGSHGIEKDLDRAFDLMTAQAEDGNAFALYDLARMCADGLGIEADQQAAGWLYTRALEAFTHAEKQPGESEKMRAYLQYRIGKMVHAGLGAERDDEKAAGWFQLSADQGNKFAQYSLGGLYYAGQGVSQNYDMAQHYYILADYQENAYACYALAKMYRDGVGTHPDQESADLHFSAAFRGFEQIEMKSPDDKIEYRLGKMYETGTGTEKDVAAATAYFEKSAELNNSYAQYALARIYMAAGDPEKTAQAISWLEKSAGHDNQFAQYSLGRLYIAGEDVEKDVPRAVKLIGASADQGNQFAQYSLGRLYLAGEEVEKDVPSAVRLLGASAGQGNQFAQYALGREYLIEGKTQKALQYFRLAAVQGNAYARQAIDRIAHPVGRKEGVNRLRAATSINRAVRRLEREYERNVRDLQREFERDQDAELERSKEQSI